MFTFCHLSKMYSTPQYDLSINMICAGNSLVLGLSKYFVFVHKRDCQHCSKRNSKEYTKFNAIVNINLISILYFSFYYIITRKNQLMIFVKNTLAPCFSKAWTVANPMPPVPPVTMPTLSLISMIFD